MLPLRCAMSPQGLIQNGRIPELPARKTLLLLARRCSLLRCLVVCSRLG